MRRESWDRNWPYMICPACKKNIEAPAWRFKCLFSLEGLPCELCSVPIKLEGNLWRGYCVGALLLVIGGTLWSKEFNHILCVLFLISGTLVLGWGIMTSQLKVVGAQDKVLPAKK